MDNSLKQKRGMMVSVGFKVAMAFIGLIFVIFALLRMYGNLKMFLGPEVYNRYTGWLKHDVLYPILPHGQFIWIFRVYLIPALLSHAGVTARLVVRNYRACGTRYKVKPGTKKKESWLSKTMKAGGMTVLLFIISHILHFTMSKIQIGGDYYRPSLYERMVASFNLGSWASVCALVIYTVAVTFASFHMWRGPYPVLMTLGAGQQGTKVFLKGFSALCGLALSIGFLVPPFIMAFGLIE